MKTPPIFVKNIVKYYVDKTFPQSKIGRPRINSTIQMIDYVYMILRTGCQWSNLNCTGSFKTVNNTFHKWVNAGIFKKSYQHFIKLYLQKRRYKNKPIKKHIIDTTFVKNIYGVNCVGRNPTDRGRKATKVSVITDEIGVTLSIVTFPANVNDCITLQQTINMFVDANIITKNVIFLADKGYDTKKCHSCIAEYKYKDGIYKKGKKIDNAVTNDSKTGRYIVENSFAWLDLYRHIYIRYDKYIETYIGMTFFALLCIGSNKINLI